MNTRQRTDKFLENLRQTPEWEQLQLTRENSPWHREPNVAVHASMLMRWYQENLAVNRSDTQYLLTMVSCAFHDMGKPLSEETKTSPERGTYRAYHGHEKVSARLWVDYAMRHAGQVLGRESLLQLELADVANVALMIEHHLPFCLKKEQKLRALKDALFQRVGEVGHRAWLDLLLADQHGRVSDNQAANLASVEKWLDEWGRV